jgi:hypothetical protein
MNDIGRFHAQTMPKNIRKPDLKAAGMQPRVTVTDELGYVYEADESGEYKRTSGLLQKLDAANIIEGAGAMSEREKLLARVKYDPESFIHHTIYQTFDGIVYEGVVTAVDVDRRSGRTFWTALYSDNESGDLWDDELIAYGVDFVDGQVPGVAVAKKSHPRALKPEQQPLPLTDDTANDNVSDPTTQIDPQVARLCGWHLDQCRRDEV